ncbi:glycoside hydrolase/deacetylase [Anaeromyces robustus]|uniref:Glycoside hydrolase/deacetylase n=1 Tax=Anaeromyces robustus TaxID=1754192 RepID=A0A1Y1XCB0_9FUNG|nr:glycoside hydrolase/deacetylase [Anaeromyces robustus]|eukprot:ORX83421.1 glycoside hydrolase/deacetylase [Anaeromyces robustus]
MNYRFKYIFLIFVIILNAVQAIIKTFDHCINTRNIVLTFSNGPNLGYTNKLLDILDEENIKATFFINSTINENNGISTNTDAKKIIKREYDSGHIIGSQIFIHDDTSNLEDEIKKLNNVIKNIIGVKPTFFRSANGEYNNNILQILEKCNMNANILWNLDSDKISEKSNIFEQYKNFLGNLNPDSFIIVNSDIQNDLTLVNLKNIITYIKSLGYTFISLDECIGLSPYQKVEYTNKKNDSNIDKGEEGEDEEGEDEDREDEENEEYGDDEAEDEDESKDLIKRSDIDNDDDEYTVICYVVDEDETSVVSTPSETENRNGTEKATDIGNNNEENNNNYNGVTNGRSRINSFNYIFMILLISFLFFIIISFTFTTN